MKLAEKTRIGGSIKRKYDIPKTPYQPLMESRQVSDRAKMDKLYQAYEGKRRI